MKMFKIVSQYICACVFLLIGWFLKMCFSQGKAETQLKCGGIFNNHVIAKCTSERISTRHLN